MQNGLGADYDVESSLKSSIRSGIINEQELNIDDLVQNMVDDFLLTSFRARLYGQRAAKRNRVKRNMMEAARR